MAQDKKFGLGIVFGAVIGAVAGLFLSPKSGKENREDFLKKVEELKKKLYEAELDKKIIAFVGEASKETKEHYFKTKKVVIKNLADLKEKVEDIDRAKYLKAVKDAVEEIKEEHEIPLDKIEKIKKMLEADWVKITEKPKKKTTK